jgi:CoA:oxalate CoA-transferase
MSETASKTIRPLSGVRVIDFTQVFAGPFCTFQLSLLGAEVIKVESTAGGDTLRGYRLGRDGMGGQGGSFIAINAGKKSVALNLKTEGGREAAKRLVASGDVLVENFRTGVLDRFGLSWKQCQEINKRLIYVTMSGFGANGPLKDYAAYDHTMQAMSGMMSLNGEPGSPPVKVGFPVVDSFTGYVAAFGTLAALLQRAQTGEGQFIDVSMLDASLVLMTSMVIPYLNAGIEPKQPGNRGYSGSPTSDLFETIDGHLSLGANTQDQFENLCEAIGAPQIAADPRFAARDGRMANHEALSQALREVFAKRPVEEWEEVINAAGVPAAKLRTILEACGHPQLEGRNLFQRLPMSRKDPTQISVMNNGFKADWNGVDQPSPMLGEHTDAVLGGLGYSADELAALRDGGAVA